MMDKRTPWPFKPMTSLASDTQDAQPLAKRVNSKRRLTEDEKNRIFELHGQGMTNTAIGKEIGCTDVAVGYALKRRKVQLQTADAVQPGRVKRMPITLQQDTWEWFKHAHPGVVMRIEAFIGNDEMFWLVDAFLRGYMYGVGLNMDSRDSILANFHQNYWSKS